MVSKLAAVCMVGGSGRMPLVGAVLHHAFKLTPTRVSQPELVVAEGNLHAVASTTTRPETAVDSGAAAAGSSGTRRKPPRPTPTGPSPNRSTSPWVLAGPGHVRDVMINGGRERTRSSPQSRVGGSLVCDYVDHVGRESQLPRLLSWSMWWVACRQSGGVGGRERSGTSAGWR
jgi:hypothetical protein